MRVALAATMPLILVVACSEGDSSRPVSRVDREPAGANCAFGGSVVRTGLDRDGNGILDDGEVTAVQYACDDGAALLLRSEAEPAGANCASGGTVVRAGLDADGDGTLDDAEVAKTTYACGAAPAPVLTATRAEPAGSRCDGGGTRVDAGRDANGDGVLQEGEIATTSYVCGASVLSFVGAEPAGAHCTLGGTAVRSGADVDGDGTLGSTEVTNVDYVCESAVLSGFVVATQEDANLLHAASVVKGDVVVESPTLESVSIPAGRVLGSIVVRNSPKLKYASINRAWYDGLGVTVAGSVIVQDNPALLAISFPGDLYPASATSRIVGDLVVQRNSALTYSDLGLGGLAQVDGSILVDGNAKLQDLYLSGLKRVGGDLRIRANPALGTNTGKIWIAAESIGGSLVLEGPGQGTCLVTLPNLVTAGGIRLTRLDHWADVWAPDLRLVTGSVSLEDNTALATVGGDALLAIDGDFVVRANSAVTGTGQMRALEWIGGDLSIASNPKLVAVWLPSLRGARDLTLSDNASLEDLQSVFDASFTRLESLESLYVWANPALAHLRLPALRTLRYLSVGTSPLVPTCEVTALVSQVSSAPWTNVSGTDDAASCP